MSVPVFEKLGVFYLGGRVDDAGKVHPDQPVLYDAKDLTTHAVVLGMTGSGKTGLGVAMIEEAILDGVPVLAIDPKGDLANLLLSFPELRPEDFRPWVDEGDALRQGKDPDEQARFLAELWRKGLAEWGQGPQRIEAYRGAAERAVYTPGSDAGRPLALLRSLDAPAPALRVDPEAMRDRVAGAVGGLLSLLGLEADPVRSRETLLLTCILDEVWKQGRSVDLPGLIRLVQEPPVERIGVFDLESFYPQAERFELAMQLNALLASPGFAAWGRGEPLDIASLLFTAEGRPKLSVLSIAHLDERERMFFVTLLMNELLAWSRTQPGTRTLRALFYMDEVYGYLPPVANPPSKRPLLTLLKQARASGLGLVLATQNPVDLDYKALSNIGTWMLGRLQTERDKARVLDGLESIGGPGLPSRAELDTLLSSLDSRVFLMRNVHEDVPVLMHVRWVLNYLAGPMTKAQLRRLKETEPAMAGPVAESKRTPMTGADPAPLSDPAPDVVSVAGGPAEAELAPVLPPTIPQLFVAPVIPCVAGHTLLYRPALAGRAALHYANARAGIDQWIDIAVVGNLRDPLPSDPWEGAENLEVDRQRWLEEPSRGARFVELPSRARDPKTFSRWAKMLKTALYRDRPLRLLRCSPLKLTSRPGEDEGAFRARMRERIREERDLKIEKLRRKYAPKLERLRERIRSAEERVEREREQLGQQKMSTAINVGATVLGALFGRKLRSTANVTRAGTAMRAAGRVSKEKADISRAEERLQALQAKLDALGHEFEEGLEAVRERFSEEEFDVEEVKVSPRKGDLDVVEVALLWLPYCIGRDGTADRAF